MYKLLNIHTSKCLITESTQELLSSRQEKHKAVVHSYAARTKTNGHGLC